jgi:hypothetical protein
VTIATAVAVATEHAHPISTSPDERGVNVTVAPRPIITRVVLVVVAGLAGVNDTGVAGVVATPVPPRARDSGAGALPTVGVRYG